MIDVRLTYSTDDGQQEVPVHDGRVSFGRGGDADHRIDDDGLSRLHATVYQEGERVWITDENSTNGTFVNGERVPLNGTPLNDGDIVRIGNHTNLQVVISRHAAGNVSPEIVSSTVSTTPAAVVKPQTAPFSILPIVLIAGAIFVIAITTVVIGFTVLGSSKPTVVSRTQPDPDGDDSDDPEPKATPVSRSSPSTQAEPSPAASEMPLASNTDNSNIPNIPAGKKYQEMSDAEKRQYLGAKAMRVAQIIGNNSSEAIPPAAIDKIKSFVDGYASRLKVRVRTGSCGFSDNLQATFERASKNAPFIVRAFNEKGMDPRIGLYLAMIESEHCICLQSGTGPLGMFQFTYATAKLHFTPSDGVVKGASPSNPDIRCQPEPAARAAASYMKALTGRYGTGPSSVPLAIGSYNSGEGGLSSNLEKALSSGQGLERDFWALIAKSEILSKQFQAENFKYVPKFFAAAIIGENPQDFGLTLQPISSYSK